MSNTATLVVPDKDGAGLPEGTDDLDRPVYGLFGVPIDATDLAGAIQRIQAAVDQRVPFFLSTANLNFLIMSRTDEAFREAVLSSDLCTPDGMPVVWLAKLAGLPIETRVSGADLFQTLKRPRPGGKRIDTFLFGGSGNAAESVSNILNAQDGGLRCVGALNPGFGTVEDFSSDLIINKINSTRPDLLAVFFSAKKAQAWLLNNSGRLDLSVRAQFGATINFEAGTIKRAPSVFQKVGLEWLWRIKEEPYLWRRYWKDGLALLGLLLMNVLPLAIVKIGERRISKKTGDQFKIECDPDDETTVVRLCGAATARHVDEGISQFRNALQSGKQITIDIANVTVIDQRYLGLFLMVRKQLQHRGQVLSFTKVPARLRRNFELNRFEYLLVDRL